MEPSIMKFLSHKVSNYISNKNFWNVLFFFLTVYFPFYMNWNQSKENPAAFNFTNIQTIINLVWSKTVQA